MSKHVIFFYISPTSTAFRNEERKLVTFEIGAHILAIVHITLANSIEDRNIAELGHFKLNDRFHVRKSSE
jgi:hypothetical protein